jgi:hypothetical protein
MWISSLSSKQLNNHEETRADLSQLRTHKTSCLTSNWTWHSSNLQQNEQSALYKNPFQTAAFICQKKKLNNQVCTLIIEKTSWKKTNLASHCC